MEHQMNVPAKPSLVAVLAAKHNMDPAAFYRTIQKTIMPANASEEQTAALLMVAQQYDLNPLLKQIYAFPSKGGGITPIISVDGWCELINRQPAFDGMEFEDAFDDDGKIYAITCRMFRKDRSRPTTVTEYLAECQRATDPWRTSPSRMLRHRAMIQAARLTFGLSGAFDEGHQLDDAPVEVNMEPIRRQVAPPAPKKAPPAAPNGKKEVKPDWVHQGIKAEEKAPAVKEEEERIAGTNASKKEAIVPAMDEPESHHPETGELFDAEEFLSELDTSFFAARTSNDLKTIWTDYDVQTTLVNHPLHYERAVDLGRYHRERIEKGTKT
jgi:phage recombination protein Bet